MRCFFVLLPALLVAGTVTDQGQTLFRAIHDGDLKAVRSALKSGADPNQRDGSGATALMHAAAFAPIAHMQALLEAGARVNDASNSGFTALMWAVPDPAKVRLLLSRGADTKPTSKDGNTALVLARQNLNADTVPLLLSAGAQDIDGMDAATRPLLKLPPRAVLEIHGICCELMHLAKDFTPLFLAAQSIGPRADRSAKCWPRDSIRTRSDIFGLWSCRLCRRPRTWATWKSSGRCWKRARM